MTIILKGPYGLEHPSVKSVIEIAEEILDQNKFLNTDLLYNKAKRRLKLPRKGLLTIIQLLLNKKILVEGSKFTKESVLSNPFRKNIYNFVKTHLGAHFSIIRKEIFSDLEGKIGSAGQLIWHLEMLLKFNYIKPVKFKKYTIFIPIEMDEEIGIIFFLLRDDINKKIVNLLIEQDTIKKSDVHKLINEKRENIYYRINDLMNYNIISLIEEEGKELCLNPDKKELIVQIFKKMSHLFRQKILMEEKQQLRIKKI